MRKKWRGVMPLLVATTAISVSACTASKTEAHEAVPSASQGVYGSPANPGRPDPTNVATDSPVVVAPTTEGVVRMTYIGWDKAAGAVEAAGFVPGVVESHGTCVLTLTSGGSSITASVAGTADASSTSCGGLTVPGASVSPGTWGAVLTYESSASRATSEATQVVIP